MAKMKGPSPVHVALMFCVWSSALAICTSYPYSELSAGSDLGMALFTRRQAALFTASPPSRQVCPLCVRRTQIYWCQVWLLYPLPGLLVLLWMFACCPVVGHSPCGFLLAVVFRPFLICIIFALSVRIACDCWPPVLGYCWVKPLSFFPELSFLLRMSVCCPIVAHSPCCLLLLVISSDLLAVVYWPCSLCINFSRSVRPLACECWWSVLVDCGCAGCCLWMLPIYTPLPPSFGCCPSSLNSFLFPAMDVPKSSAPPSVPHPVSSYAGSVKFGSPGSGLPEDSSVSVPAQPPSPPQSVPLSSPVLASAPPASPDLRTNESLPSCPLLPRVPAFMDELATLCLLAKLWGEVLPMALIIAKTKTDWKYIKGSVDYIDLGNGWVLLKFSSVADKEYVWVNRPWFVKGLNLVLNAWKPYFDPYSASISRVDQWIRIPRLPWEFWEQETLTELLRNVGSMVRVDHTTLLRQKGKFARVCLNLDISKPLPGTLRIPTPLRELSIPIIYEGLHEVCALCGSTEHSLDQCPKVPSLPKIEVVIEQFQSYGIGEGPSKPPNETSSDHPPPQPDKWIRVAPKKRGRPPLLSKDRKGFSGGIRIKEPIPQGPNSSPSSNSSAAPMLHNDKGKGKSVVVDLTFSDDLNPPMVSGVLSAAPILPMPTLPIIPPPSQTLPLSSASHASSFHPSPVSPMYYDDADGSPMFAQLMDQEGDDDIFMDLEDLHDSALSSDSSKKRKIEDEEETSSLPHY